MTRYLLFIIIAIATSLEPAMADKLPAAVIEQKRVSKLIIGKWEGDKGNRLQFLQDGSYICTNERQEPSTVKGRWHIDGNQLLIDFNDGKHFARRILYLREDRFALEGRHHEDVFERSGH